jgi:hypothetical protein
VLASAVHQAAAHSFTHGLSIGCLVAAGVSAVGAVLVGVWLPAQPPQPAQGAAAVPAAQPATARG